MFPLAFVAGWIQGHWWGFISRNYVVWPTSFLMNVFIALKGSHFWFYISSLFGTAELKVIQTTPVIWPRWPPCLIWNLAYRIRNSSTTQFIQMMTLGWSLTFLRKDQLWFLMPFVWENAWILDYSESIKGYDIKVGIYSKLNEYVEICIHIPEIKVTQVSVVSSSF